MPSLLILGATGYIGGSILRAIREAHPQIEITALVRSSTDIHAVKSLGVRVVHLNTSDLSQVSAACSSVDIVVNAADADNLPLTCSVLRGLRHRYAEGKSAKRKPILIHTSGTGVVADDAEGTFTDYAKKVWNDNVEEDIEAISPSQPHRNVDLEIFAADREGYVSTYIIAPSTIYGYGSGPVNKLSQQIPGLIRLAVERRQAVFVGKGTNVWNNVHIQDLGDLYLLVLKLALSGDGSGSPYSRFYWASAAEHAWGDVVKAMAPVLYKIRAVDAPDAFGVPLSGAPNQVFTANNSRTISERGFELGWKPSRPSVFDTLEHDVKTTLTRI
ncbi:NAD(P)-binding protein [Sistotremastrum niveocremeum HHB9708]|uniref:NAD(P)-binding protein n=1 Tax=Sistotremastrum niveocremeum HHB9708 TaxID=1314777 RepID=A0A165A551_9AGAM|nr:NAD(P)-binding protein [Sistotremastrum niveocremeum HHB9708]